MHILGVDVGGTGIKSAIIDTASGKLVGEKIRIETPRPPTPKRIGNALCELIQAHKWNGPVGIGLPAVIRNHEVCTAVNIDSSFIGLPAAPYFSALTGCPIFIANDADVAGLAEIRFGAGKGVSGVVLIVTIGTGLGTALFIDGKLLPNTELGHLLLDNGIEAERYASESARVRQKLGWKTWGRRFNRYLTAMENLFWPDLIILGGGISKKREKFLSMITTRAPVVTAGFFNRAGIVGAALYAESGLLSAKVSEQVELSSAANI